MVAADRVQTLVVVQHLVDVKAISYQHAVRGAQHAGTMRPDGRPDAGAFKIALRLGVFQRGFPGLRSGLGTVCALGGNQRLNALPPLGDGPRPFAGLTRAGACQACQFIYHPDRRREQVRPPLQTHQGGGLTGALVVAIQRNLVRLVLLLKTEIARLARDRHTQQRIALARESAAAVAPADPALDYFKLLGNAGVVGHEHQAPVGI